MPCGFPSLKEQVFGATEVFWCVSEAKCRWNRGPEGTAQASQEGWAQGGRALASVITNLKVEKECGQCWHLCRSHTRLSLGTLLC